MKLLNTEKKKAFTLIELLVVIAIIGLLSTIVLASLSSARTKARDAKKGEMVKQWQNAIEMYYYDNSNTYPDSEEASIYRCLGEDYPDPGNVTYKCVVWGKETETFNAKLREYYPSMPITDEKMPDGSGKDYRGIGYARCDLITCTDSDAEYQIKWYLENKDGNDESCIAGTWWDGGSGYDSCIYSY